MTPEDVKIPDMPKAPRLSQPKGTPWLSHELYCEGHLHEFAILPDGECQLLHHTEEDIKRQAGFAELGGKVLGCFKVAALAKELTAGGKKLPESPDEFFNKLVSELRYFWHTADPEAAKAAAEKATKPS